MWARVRDRRYHYYDGEELGLDNCGDGIVVLDGHEISDRMREEAIDRGRHHLTPVSIPPLTETA
jgi:hypothetical protein